MNNDINTIQYLLVKFGEMAMVIMAAVSVWFVCSFIYHVIYERD